jgi:hypothetical protein
MALGKGLKEGPFEAAAQLEPAHKLGAPLKQGEELMGNRHESHRAQAQATVHQLQQGVTGKGIGAHTAGRRGRKGRTR